MQSHIHSLCDDIRKCFDNKVDIGGCNYHIQLPSVCSPDDPEYNAAKAAGPDECPGAPWPSWPEFSAAIPAGAWPPPLHGMP